MKKRFYIMILIAVTMTAGQDLSASRLYQESGIIPNHSVEYVRTLNRSASIDADAAFYNPAGLAFMENTGLSVMFSSQTYNVRKEHTMDYYSIELEPFVPVQTFHTRSGFTGGLPDYYYAETVAPVLPDLCVVYNTKEWAAYFHVGVMQAANGMYFPNGLAVIDWGNLATIESQLAMTDPDVNTNVLESFSSDADATRTEYFIGGTLGAAYRVLDWMSVSLGGRYIRYSGRMEINVRDVAYVVDGTYDKDPDKEWDIDTSYSGNGGSVCLGLHFNPISDLHIGFKSEYFTPVKMTKKTNTFKVNPLIETSGSLNLFKDGTPGEDMVYTGGNGDSTFMMQYPMQFNLGVSYFILKSLKVEVSGELTLRNLRDMDGREDDYKTFGYRYGGAVEWWFMKNACISAGYSYNDFGIKDDKRNEADPLLPSHTIGAGMGFVISDRFDFNVGASYEYFPSKGVYSTEYTNVSAPTYHYLYKTFDEKRIAIAVGLTYRFLGSSADGSESEAMKKMEVR